MLLDRACTLSTRIAEYKEIRATAEEAEHFETRAEQFDGVAGKLRMALNRIAGLRAIGVLVQFAPANSQDLLKRTQELRALVQDDVRSLVDPPFDLRYEFVDRLRAIHTAAEKAALDAWAEYVRGHAAGHSEDILNALAVVPQFKPIVVRMRECKAKIDALASTVPASPAEAVSHLKDLAVNHRSAWEEMTEDGIPAPVIGFLKACAGTGAPLNALTEEVRNWLVQRNLLGAFRIRI